MERFSFLPLSYVKKEISFNVFILADYIKMYSFINNTTIFIIFYVTSFNILNEYDNEVFFGTKCDSDKSYIIS